MTKTNTTPADLFAAAPTVRAWLDGAREEDHRELRTGLAGLLFVVALYRVRGRGRVEECVASAEGATLAEALVALEEDAICDERAVRDVEADRARAHLLAHPLACPECGNRALDCWTYIPYARRIVQDPRSGKLLATTDDGCGQHWDRDLGRADVTYLGCPFCNYGHKGESRDRWVLDEGAERLVAWDTPDREVNEAIAQAANAEADAIIAEERTRS